MHLYISLSIPTYPRSGIATIGIGIGIGISIGEIFSSVLGIESIGKKWYRSTFNLNA